MKANYRCTIDFSVKLPDIGYDMAEFERSTLTDHVIYPSFRLSTIYMSKPGKKTYKKKAHDIVVKFEKLDTILTEDENKQLEFDFNML
jgi:hypothetical protein